MTSEPGKGRYTAGDDRPRRRWLPAVLGMLAGAVLTGLAIAVLSWESTTIVRSEQQPSTVSYPDDSTHYLALRRYVSIATALDGDARFELWLGRDPGLGYGHAVALDFTGADVGRFEALWTQEGVELRFASGHLIKVPAESFTGGR
jgi:hypothetical protein